jgi:ElaB/YqjD/DUF883 family membrane-anchored ribosome-binding protein
MKNDLTSNTMHDIDALSQNAADKAAGMADSLAGSADRALDTAQQVADRTLDNAKRGVQDLRDRTESAASQLGAKAGELAEKGIASAKQTADKAKGLYNRYSEATVAYVAEQPMRSVLISAAVGAVITALVMSGRQRSRR